MNPLTTFFTLAGRQADIRRGLQIYDSIKPQLTELIDLVRDIGGEAGFFSPHQMAVTPVGTQPSTVPPALKQYDTQWIQRALNKLDAADLAVDGDLGSERSATRNAVRDFQKRHGLTVDGWPGVQTAAVLAQELARVGAA